VRLLRLPVYLQPELISIVQARYFRETHPRDVLLNPKVPQRVLESKATDQRFAEFVPALRLVSIVHVSLPDPVFQVFNANTV
jgi:hypothetical protein